MAAHDSFLAMILTNARREEAVALAISVERGQPRIDMRLLDGSSRALQTPPAEIVLRMIEALEQGRNIYESSVFLATVESVDVQRGVDNVVAHIAAWSIEHR